MKTYILLDLANVFFRSRHVVRGDIDTKLGMALHITMSSILKAWRDFKADHVVVALEGRSWRKDFYEPYKRNRKETRDAMSPREQEEDRAFWEVFDEFKNFVKEKTNCTVLHNSVLEADDLIAGWIQYHPDDNHIIISTDGDFAQLIAPNVRQYNGVQNMIVTHQGYFDEKGKHIVDKKTKQPKCVPDPEWLLFEKCMRGDSSDNVFSAYPGVRIKGSKNKVGLTEAFADKKNKGYNWNNLMLQRWVDHNGAEHRVFDDYQRNVILCDLTAQPNHIKQEINTTIHSVESKTVTQVGIKLMKFCAKWNLQKIADHSAQFAEAFNSKYLK